MKSLILAVFALVLASQAQAACTSPTGATGQFQWISANSDMEFCNGTNWVSSLVASTASTCSTAGMVQVNAGSTDLQFCDGTYWNSMTSTLSDGSCTGTAAGTFRYSSGNKWEEWCDGTSWWVMYAQPTLNLNFLSGTLPTPVQFSRASGANVSPGTYYNSSGTLTNASENLLTYSQDFTQASAWTNGAGSIAASATTAPDGTSTGTHLIDASGTSGFLNTTPSPMSATGNYCASLYMKAAEDTQAALVIKQWSGSYPYAVVYFDLSAGAILSENYPSGFTKISSSITSAGSGWYRGVICASLNISSAAKMMIYTASGGSLTYSGTGTSGIYIWGAQLENSSSASGLIYTAGAAAYAPRFDYNPSTLSLNGLLIEESRTNLLTTSTYALTGNTGGSASLVASSTLAPDGTTAPVLTDNSTNGRHFASKYATLTAGSAYTYSVYLMAGTLTSALIYAGKSGSPYTRGGMTVNLSNGTFVGANSGSPTSVTDQLVTAVGNGWYRVSMTVVIDGTSTDGYLEVDTMSGGASSYAGTGNGIYIWGAQVELGAFPTSYIPTSGTSLTRNADTAVVNSTSWFGSGPPVQGTLVATAMAGYMYNNSTSNVQQVAVSLEADFNDRISVRRVASTVTTTDGNLGGINYQGGTSVPFASGANGTWPELASKTVAIGFQSGSSAIAGAGSFATSSTAYTPFTPTQLGLGASAYYGVNWNGWLQSVQYYNTRLTNSQLTQLATGVGLP